MPCHRWFQSLRSIIQQNDPSKVTELLSAFREQMTLCLEVGKFLLDAKTIRKPCDLNFRSDKVTSIDHCDTAMQQWLVDRLTGWPWQFEGIASEHQKAALHLGSSLIAEIQLMHQINVSGCVTAVTVFWTSDFCQGDLAPVVAEELKQVGKMRVKTKTTQWNT